MGEVARARELGEKLLSLASPLDLYAEELDARSGRHLGNFSQALTDLALINAVAPAALAFPRCRGLREHGLSPGGRTWARRRRGGLDPEGQGQMLPYTSGMQTGNAPCGVPA
jgi:hypothetical protein